MMGLRGVTWIVLGACTLLALLCGLALGSAVSIGFFIGVVMVIGAVEAEES